MEDLLALLDLLLRHSREPFHVTPIPGLTLMRSGAVSSCMIAAVYSPMAGVIAQGRKRVVVGSTTLDYAPGEYLVSSVDLPVSARIVDATPEHPYLALSLELDPKLLAAVMVDLPVSREGQGFRCGVAVSPIEPTLLGAFVRLLRLLDTPLDVAHLAPLVLREIYYRLLTGEQANMLWHMASPQNRVPQVLKAIGWIRKNYAKPLRISTLARQANMSPASLHRQFKAVTAMSPLQYQKQIRLQEARQIMLAESMDAASAGHAVGYGSPSQFSREHHRMFGISPKRHISHEAIGEQLVR